MASADLSGEWSCSFSVCSFSVSTDPSPKAPSPSLPFMVVWISNNWFLGQRLCGYVIREYSRTNSQINLWVHTTSSLYAMFRSRRTFFRQQCWTLCTNRQPRHVSPSQSKILLSQASWCSFSLVSSWQQAIFQAQELVTDNLPLHSCRSQLRNHWKLRLNV